MRRETARCDMCGCYVGAFQDRCRVCIESENGVLYYRTLCRDCAQRYESRRFWFEQEVSGLLDPRERPPSVRCPSAW